MSNVFFASDHHFHHANILNFKRDDGVTPLRVFDDVDHMNEHMVMQHNRVVGVKDKVYFLGDVTVTKTAEGLKILGRMNGEKILVRGNHDLCKLSQYAHYFSDVRGVARLDGLVMSHIPLHPESLERWGVNVHGHLHHREVRMSLSQLTDFRYYSVCMERLNDYTPISLEDLKKNFK